jgi:hypothetical protein
MALTNEHLAIAASIDKAVSAFPDTAGGMEHLLVHMHKYMSEFKRILDTAAPGDLDMCSELQSSDGRTAIIAISRPH